MNTAFAATLTEDGKFSISGVSAQRITSFTGTGSSIAIDLGNGPIESGEISFSLDETKTNVLLYNFDSGYTTLDINILLDAPVLSDLGEEPVSFNLIESALLPAFNIVEEQAPSKNTNFTYIAEGFISQPLLNTEETSVIGGGTIGNPEGNFITIELVDPQPILFIGGGLIESGVFEGFEYWNSNVSETTEKVIEIAEEALEIINEVIDIIGHPEPQPENDPPPEAPEAPAFNPYPKLPQPVRIASTQIPESSTTKGIIGLGILGISLIFKPRLWKIRMASPKAKNIKIL